MDTLLNLDPMNFVVAIAVILPLGIIVAAISFFVTTIRQALKEDRLLKDEKAVTVEKALREEKASKDDKAPNDNKELKDNTAFRDAPAAKTVPASGDKTKSMTDKAASSGIQVKRNIDAVHALLVRMDDSELVDALSAVTEQLRVRIKGIGRLNETSQRNTGVGDKVVKSSSIEQKGSSPEAD